MITGVYCISFLPSPKVYIGSSNDVDERFTDHRGRLPTKTELRAVFSFSTSIINEDGSTD